MTKYSFAIRSPKPGMKRADILATKVMPIALFLCAVLNASAAGDNLIVNEICVANVDRYIDHSYNYGGWVELYNPTTSDIALGNMTLRHTDAEGNQEHYILTSSHGKVSAHGHAVLWFDHNSKEGYYGPNAWKQIPFKLDAEGGVVELLDTNGRLADAVQYPPCIARCSWMRETDGDANCGWTSTPTPNATNNTSRTAEERLQAPLVSTTGGTFANSFRFTVTFSPGTTLYYTTDGSTPQVGKSPTSADGRFDVNESTIFRFMLAREGCLNSPVVTRTFLKSDGRLTLPILSVSTAPKNLFDNTIGLYVTGTNGRVANNSKVMANQNMDWERPVNVEYFVPDAHGNYSEAINQEAEFSIFGGWTRFNEGNKDFEYRTPFKLKSDKIFEGLNYFPYPIFDSKPYIKIKNFLVRNGGQDQKARIWDAAIQELLRSSGLYLDCQAWQPAHVYLNGKYLGMMNLREESNKQFAFSNYGIDKDEMDQWEGDIVIKEGDKKKLDEWYNLSKNLANNPADTSIWNAICRLVDIDEYCNYMAAEIYMGNLDWLRGGFKNLKGFRARDVNGKFHIVLHDVDGGFGDTDMILQVLSKGTGSLPVRFKNMLRYEPFKKQFIDAYCIMDGCVFDPERCEPIITAMKNTINQALKLEGLSSDEKANLLIERIGDYEVRRPNLKKNLKTAFNLQDEYNVTLKSNLPEAKALLLNGQEIPTGKFNGYMFAPITLTASAPGGTAFREWHVNGRVVSSDSILHLSNDFSAGTFQIEAVFEHTEANESPIRINEVSAGNDIFINEYGKKADWIELYNATNRDIDLAGTYLSDDPDNAYKFRLAPPNGVSTVIPARGYKVVWCDGKDSATQLHASFKLKNDDEAYISITGADDAWGDSIRYKKQSRWYTYGRFPDGGHSMAQFERPTIGNQNRLCTTTALETSGDIGNSVAKKTMRQIASIRYYNLGGQQVLNTETEPIVIQHIIYTDGTTLSRKIVNRR